MRGGFRSLLGFWLGGVNAPPSITPPTPTPGSPGVVRKREFGEIIDRGPERRLREEEEILFL